MEQKKIWIGSGPQCDVRIDEPDVAEEHAVMYISDDMLCLELFSDNTAFLNGNEVSGKYWLNREDVLVIGSRRLDLALIEDWCRGAALDGMQGDLSYELDADGSDAVTIKRNWWPFIIVFLIILGVGVALGRRFYYSHQEKLRRMEMRRVQDSILNNQKMQMDSMTKVLKQFESE